MANLIAAGGSFDTASAFAGGQYTWDKNTIGASASGSRTSHYLNPVVPQNYSNTGTLGDFSLRYERDITPRRPPGPQPPPRNLPLRPSQ
jgi:hypothetical protein